MVPNYSLHVTPSSLVLLISTIQFLLATTFKARMSFNSEEEFKPTSFIEIDSFYSWDSCTWFLHFVFISVQSSLDTSTCIFIVL